MEENKRFFKESKEYKLYTKKIETVLSIVTLILFMLSFSGGTAAGAAFFGVSGLLLLYYFFIFRKKPHYVKLEGSKITVYDGIMLNPVVIDTENISKVTKMEKSILVEYNENGSNKSIDIKALILEPSDFNDLYSKIA